MIESLSRRYGSLPIILQTERAECGLACLAMVASFYEYRTDLNSLRRDHYISARGAALGELINIASKLSLSARALRLELEDLGQLQTPAIHHWDMTHFVVLKKLSKKVCT